MLPSGFASQPVLHVCCPPPGLEGEGPGLLHRSSYGVPAYEPVLSRGLPVVLRLSDFLAPLNSVQPPPFVGKAPCAKPPREAWLRKRSKGPEAQPAQPPRLTFRRWSLSLFYRIVRTKTPFGVFLGSLLHLSPAPHESPSKSLFPLPLPYFGIFRALSPQLGSAARSRIGVKRAVFVTVAALNYLYAGLRPVAHAPLRRPPSDLQAKALDYLERLVKACGAVEAVDPVSASRRSSKLAACLEQVCQGLTALGPSFDRYGPSFPGLPLDQQIAFDALHPYRGLDPSRLKLAGRANWDPSDFLDDLFYMPFREPQVLLLPHVGPPGAYEVPDISRELPSRVLALAKLWDSFGLLRLSRDGPETPDQAVRIFNAAKNRATDRQIGDRRGRNRHEGVLQGGSSPAPLRPCSVWTSPEPQEPLLQDRGCR